MSVRGFCLVWTSPSSLKKLNMSFDSDWNSSWCNACSSWNICSRTHKHAYKPLGFIQDLWSWAEWKCGGWHSQHDKHLILFFAPLAFILLNVLKTSFLQNAVISHLSRCVSACVSLCAGRDKLNNALDHWKDIYRKAKWLKFNDRAGHQCCTSYSRSSSTHSAGTTDLLYLSGSVHNIHSVILSLLFVLGPAWHGIILNIHCLQTVVKWTIWLSLSKWFVLKKCCS